MSRNPIRIVYMGTPEFAVAPLKALAEAGMEIAAVVTAPDKPAGRGRKLKSPAVKTYADAALDCPVLQPEKLREPGFVSTLKALEADLFVVVAFRMLPEVVWTLPDYGTINLHASLLPQYRGAAPINHVIMNGEKETGVTTFLIDEEIDTGRILMQKKISIGPDETAGSLHDRLMETGSEIVVQTVEGLWKDTLEPIEQASFDIPPGELKRAPKIYREDCKIHWDKKAGAIHNLVRGLSPFPGAFCFMRQEAEEAVQVKIFETKPVDQEMHGEPGSIQHNDKRKLFVQTGEGALEILSLQVAGKRRMTSEEFLRGFQGDPGVTRLV